MFWEHPYDNPLARMYWGKIPVEKAVAYFYFAPKAGTALMVYGAKYHGRADIVMDLGKMLADEMNGFFDDIDDIIPVPISIRRMMQRSYNQSDMIARGISKVTGLPIERHAVIRRHFDKSQTHLTRDERIKNVDAVFVLKDADALRGKHVLRVDDVITTGATTISCANQILKAENVKISILSLGYASKQKAQEVHEPMLV
jgi:ComF family protein